MKKVLIVGSNSTVGLAAGRFLEKTHQVFYAGRAQGDYLLDLSSLQPAFPENTTFDIVINSAANFGEDGDGLQLTEMVNAVGSLNVCRLAKKVGAKHVVIISSLSASYDFGDPYFGFYALSKRHGDELARLYCMQHNIPLTVLRPSQLYDADSRCRSHQRLFYSVIDKAQCGQDVDFYGDNDAVRNFIFLEDFSEIVAKVIQEGVAGIYNCLSPTSVTLSEIARTCYQVFNQNGSIRFLKDKPRIETLPESTGNDLYKKIGFFPPTSLAAGIEKIKHRREMT